MHFLFIGKYRNESYKTGKRIFINMVESLHSQRKYEVSTIPKKFHAERS